MRNCQEMKKNKKQKNSVKGGVVSKDGVYMSIGGIGTQWNPSPQTKNYKNVLFKNSTKIKKNRKIGDD